MTIATCERIRQRQRRRAVRGLRMASAVDPTRTTMLRKRFVTEMRKRWAAHQRDIAISIVDRDCFGIQPDILRGAAPAMRAMTPTQYKQFGFERTDAKIDAFMNWLWDQEQLGILETSRAVTRGPILATPWTNTFIQSAYQQGIVRGRQELRRAGFDVPAIDAQPGALQSVFNQPFHADRVALLYTRTFEDLKTVTQVTNQRIRRQLVDGLTTTLSRGIAEGRNPRQIARFIMRAVNNEINVVGKHRATLIARTEIIRAHHLANVQEYRQMQADMEVEIVAELATAGDDRVCLICEGLQATTSRNPIPLDQVEGMIPVHPQCRCVAIPSKRRDTGKKQDATTAPPEPVDPNAYKPAATLAEAEAWLHQNVDIASVQYSGGKEWYGALPKKRALEHLNIANAELDRLQRVFNFKIPHLGKVYVTGQRKVNDAAQIIEGKLRGGLATVTSVRARRGITFGDLVLDDARLDVAHWHFEQNGRWWSTSSYENANHLSKRINPKSEPNGKYAKKLKPGRPAPATVRHEVGHIIDGELGITNSPEWQTLVSNLAKFDDFTPNSISTYANRMYGSDPRMYEYWAEIFSAYTSPYYDRGQGGFYKFPKPLERFIEGVLKRLRD